MGYRRRQFNRPSNSSLLVGFVIFVIIVLIITLVVLPLSCVYDLYGIDRCDPINFKKENTTIIDDRKQGGSTTGGTTGSSTTTGSTSGNISTGGSTESADMTPPRQAGWKSIYLNTYGSHTIWMGKIVSKIMGFPDWDYKRFPKEIISVFFEQKTDFKTINPLWQAKLGSQLKKDVAREIALTIISIFMMKNLTGCDGPTASTCSNCYGLNESFPDIPPGTINDLACSYSCGGLSTQSCLPINQTAKRVVFPDAYLGDQVSMCYYWQNGNSCNWKQQIDGLRNNPMINFQLNASINWD